MSVEEAFVYDFILELTTHRGVSDAMYGECIERFGERGVIDLKDVIFFASMIAAFLYANMIIVELKNAASPDYRNTTAFPTAFSADGDRKIVDDKGTGRTVTKLA